MRRPPALALASVVVVAVLTALVASCGGPTPPQSSSEEATATVTLMTHDSFNVSPAVLDHFREESGITVKVLTAGDAGTALNQAILTKDRPVADVFFGVDNTFLTRALDAGIFAPYSPEALRDVPADLRLDPTGRATPIDYADVCVNADDAAMAAAGLGVPTDLAELADGRYKGRLVVQNPATSSPGLAFLLATVSEFGPAGWQQYWRDLRDNDVRVVDGWESAYFSEFSGGGGGGERPLVVSYATSPVATVVNADPPIEKATASVSTGTCFRQVEFAGVLEGTQVPTAARKVVDLLLSQEFQADVPLQMFVYPARTGVALPQVFLDNAAVVDHPHEVAPEQIAEHREEWIEQWRQVMLG